VKERGGSVFSEDGRRMENDRVDDVKEKEQR